MMRPLCALATAATVAACATTSAYTAPSQTYRPKGWDKMVTIRGKLIREVGMTERLKVGIGVDELLVAQGDIGRGNGDVFGRWQDRPVSALCTRHEQISYRGLDLGKIVSVQCRVLIDGELAATLVF